ARIADLDALAGMWEKLEKYHVELGGPEYRLARRWRGEWHRFARNHIGRKDRLCLAAEIDGIAVGFLLAAILQRPKVFEHRRYGHIYDVFVEAGPAKPGSGPGAGRCRHGLVPGSWSRPRGAVHPCHERPRPALLEQDGIRDDRAHHGSASLSHRGDIRWVGGNPSPVPDEARPQADPRPSHRRFP